MHKILLVDNDELSRSRVSKALQKSGYQLNETSDLDEALSIVCGDRIGLILLNWYLPTVAQINFIKCLKSDEKTKESYLILFVERDAEEKIVRGLKAGADDYLTKPFSAKVLMTRTKAWLSDDEVELSQEKTIQFDALCLDENSHWATISGQLVRLGPTEFRLLNFFMRHPNQAFCRKELITNVWNDPGVDQRAVDVHIRRLRKALVPHGYDGYIQTVRTVGYRFSNYGLVTQS